MKKRTAASILTAAMAASVVMTACGKDSQTATETQKETQEVTEKAETEAEETRETEEESGVEENQETKGDNGQESGSGEAGKRFPTDIGLEKIGNGETLTIALQSNSYIEDYENNWLTNYLEESLGVNIEFYMMPASDFQSKFSLMATGGEEMPDIVMTLGSLSQSTILDYGAKGLFIPLEEYLNNEEISPHFNAIPEEDRQEMLNLMTSADGHIYGLIKYEPQTWGFSPYRLYINQTWLDKLGLEAPKTTDELKEVLTEFVNGDPNGNGKKDEMGMYGIMGGWGQNTAVAIMNAFTFYDDGMGKNNGLALAEDGSVYAPWVTDEWRAGLEYLKDLYDNGLVASAMFSDDEDQFKAALNQEENIIGFCSVASQTVNYPDADNNKNYQEMKMIEPLTGPEGVQYTPYAPLGYTPEFFVTSSCENPELAFRFGEAFYDYALSLDNRYGQEGVDWTDDPEICAKYSNGYKELGLIDEIKVVTNLGEKNTWGEVNSQFWHNIGPRYTPASLTDAVADGSTEFDPDSKNQMAAAECYQMYDDKHPEQLLPVLNYSLEEGEENTQIIMEITDMIKTSMAEFITGTRPLDDDGWQQYLDQMNNAGLETWIENAQAAYDRIQK